MRFLSRRLLLLAALLVLFGTWADAQAQSSDRFSGHAFGDYYWALTHHNRSIEGLNGFRFRQIYFTYDQPLTASLSTRLRLQLNSPGDYTSEDNITPTLKDAYLQWELSEHDLFFGLVTTPIWEVVEEFWGYRPVERTALDVQERGSSRDIGIGAMGPISSSYDLRYHVVIGNGAGRAAETNRGKKVAASLSGRPTELVLVEVYADYEARPEPGERYTVQGFVGYGNDDYRIGLQGARQITRSTEPNQTFDLISTFAAAGLSENVSVLGRYDRYFDANPEGEELPYLPFHPQASSHYFLAGLDFSPNSRVSILPNVQVVRYDHLPDGSRPTADVIPQMTLYFTRSRQANERISDTSICKASAPLETGRYHKTNALVIQPENTLEWVAFVSLIIGAWSWACSMTDVNIPDVILEQIWDPPGELDFILIVLSGLYWIGRVVTSPRDTSRAPR